MDSQRFYDEVNQKTVRDYPKSSTLHGMISSQCDKSPSCIAVVDASVSLTYAEVEAKSNQIANYLRSLGVTTGDLVGVCCDRNAETPCLLLGIMKSGAGYVPLDPDYPVDRLVFMVENAQVKHVLGNENQRALMEQFNAPYTIMEQARDEIAACGKDRVESAMNPAKDIAYVIYTSGSTGKPKGVQVQHSAATNYVRSMLEVPQFTEHDRILATTTLSFDISIFEMFVPLVAGGSLAVVSRETAKDTSALVAAIQQFEVTYLQATPAMWRMIVENGFESRPGMKFITAGEPLPRDLIRPMLNHCSELWNFYGPTETTVFSTGTRVLSDQGRILIGTPIANTQVYVVDEQGELCPPEQPGELLIAGDGVTLGYLNRPELNANSFIDFKGRRAYRTGDLARMTVDGQIDHLGRIDNQIKFNGHRIELGEIDAAMAMQPGVRQAATVLREDRPGDKRLVGYLLAQPHTQPNILQIREAISKQLPDYMVPNSIVVVDAFHYTPSGKLDRKAFGPPSTARPDVGVEFVAPKSDREIALTRIWSDVLQIDTIGMLDNFFDLGGNSIRAVKVIARLKSELNIEVTGAEFFDNPTPASFLGMADKKAALIAKLQSNSHSNRKGSGAYAIVGMAARLPGAKDLNQFWENLVAGKESIKFFEKDELDPTLDPADTNDKNYVAARGIIEDADHFDAQFFKTTPRNAELIDPQQRIMLELAWTALEDAGIIPNKTEDTIGIWAGTYSTSYFIKNLLSNPDLVRQTGEFQIGVYNEKDYIATRVAHALNLTGPAVNVNTACSTSLVALIEACKSLEAGHCDVAIAGAASVTFPQNSGHLHQTGSIFTPDGHCRPFDANGAGTLFSDGAGVAVVKRLEDAVANGDRIYAVINGFGINNDGSEKASFSAPSINGQVECIAMAHSMSGVDAESIGYIEAHGTATPIGDPIEVTALRTVFEAQTDAKQFCAIGSVKSNIGHTVSAAGIAGLIKTAMALYKEQIPATLHYERPNPQIDFEKSPFYVCDSLTEWKRSDRPRRAGVSSFGVGGTNAHILLEEAPIVADQNQKSSSANELPILILPISGKTEDALNANVNKLAEQLAVNPDLSKEELAAVAQSLQHGRDEFAYRAAIVVENAKDAAELLRSKKTPRFMKRKSSASPRDVVFMFPGQGSQYVRMGQSLYEHSQVFRQHLDECSEILKPILGRDLRDVLFPSQGKEEAAQEILRNTQFTQPALFAIGYSLAKVWQAWGVMPSAMMGHSIGEFAAACIAGVFKLDDALRMIAERGRAMQALPGGSMMSVKLPGAQVEPLLWGDMAIASYNGPELCVVAGPIDQVAELHKQLDAKDIVCRHLHTSHAFHSPMMNEIVAPFAEFISQFELNAPTVPILSTVTGKWMTAAEATDPNYWAEHLRKPVRFSDAVTAMWSEDPSRILIELGPRQTLATLSKQHAADPKAQTAIATLSDNADSLTEWNAMLSAIAQLWLAGGKVCWSKLSSDGQIKAKSRHVDLPTYEFQRSRYFIKPGQIARVKSIDSTASANIGTIASTNQETTTQETSPIGVAQLVNPNVAPNAVPNVASPIVQPSFQPELISMSRVPNIINAIHHVFENTSGFDLTQFSGDTTFFEMGLDSLVLTQTATALKKEMDFEVTFRQLLEETPTVDSLAQWLDANLPAEKYAAVKPVKATFATLAEPEKVRTPPPVQASVQPQTQPQVEPQPQTQLPSQAQWLPASTSQPLMNNMTTATTVPIAQASGSAAYAIVQSQLQLMAAQLQLLGGQPIPSIQTVAIPVASAAQTSPSQVASVNSTIATPPSVPSSNVATKTSEVAASTPSPKAPAATTNDEEIAPKAKRFATVKLSDGTLEESQQKALDGIIRMNNAMLPKSKAYAQQHRKYMADPRTVSGFRPNMKEMTHPIVVERSKGVSLWDIDGNEYIDFTCGFGSNLLGHSHEIIVNAITEQVQKDFAIGPQSPLAGEVARLFCELTGNERMAFSNTGSEAVLGCTRLARNASGRDLIVMFNGDYHGILDEVIVRGSKKLKSFPAATGIPKEHVGNTLVLDYGTDEALQIIRERIDEIAGILVEPVQSRTPELQPREFLQSLRKLTQNEPTALIFDEVISGLRIGLGGAQEHFGVRADLAAYGKIVGGGMPIGVVAGKAKYMDGFDGGFWQYGDDSRPEAGMTYFAGTFVRHPLTLAASKAILLHLKKGGQPMYDRLNALANYLADELNQVFKDLDAPMYLANFGSLFKIQFKQELVYSEVFFAGLRRRGMHIWDHRPCLLTLAHNKYHVDQLVTATREATIEAQRYGFMPGEGYKKYSNEFNPNNPPQIGARTGKDSKGKPGWFIPDTGNPGQYLQVGLPIG